MVDSKTFWKWLRWQFSGSPQNRGYSPNPRKASRNPTPPRGGSATKPKR